MKPIFCGLVLLAFGLVLFACAGDDDDDNDDTAADDDTEDDDDAADDDDDTTPGFDLQRLAVFGFDSYYNVNTALLWIHHFNGFLWNTPVDTEPGYLASDIWGIGAEQVFVVGHSQSTNRAMVYHYDGTQWRVQDIETSFGRFYVDDLWSVSGSSSDDVYVLGSKVNALSVYKGKIILHYDGQDWRASYTASYNSGNWINLFDLWCAQSGEVFAVGDWTDDGLNDRSFVVHNDSGPWVETKDLDPQGTRCSLNTVWGAAADDVFAAGICYNNRVLVLHYDGDQWHEMDTSGLENNMLVKDISGASGQEVYLAANTYEWGQPRIYFFDGSTWTEQQQINRAIKDHGPIRSIWATPSSELYIVNNHLDIYDHNTQSVRTIESPNLTKVWAPASNYVD